MAGEMDPLNFCKAEDYFTAAKGWKGPTEVKRRTTTPPIDAAVEGKWFGMNLYFDDGTLGVVQLVRPTVWRVRYDPSFKSSDDYSDENTSTIVMDEMTQLVDDLDKYRDVQWSVEHSETLECYSMTSLVKSVGTGGLGKSIYKAGDGMTINIWKKPFRIQVVRTLIPLSDPYVIPGVAEPSARQAPKVVWQTSPATFRQNLHPEHPMLKDVCLDVIKPGHGEYVGFGEQGGMAFMKVPTYMNFFNFDNMQYQQVYNGGPTDDREPLYHSDPFWLELNSNPEHKNITAAFIDNYSQISLDFGKTNSSYLKVGTRFGGMDFYGMTADTVPEIVRLYTGLIGRPKLKPRYILGNHQACYGYAEENDLHEVVRQYREWGIPLDGLHVDVDFQDNFRTFTMNPRTFPDPKKMFKALADKGIKCSTNITPIISVNDREGGYNTLISGKANNYFIKDIRYTEGTSGHPNDVRYFFWEGGRKRTVDPKDRSQWPDFGDDYDFNAKFNSHDYYRGAVGYGYKNGTAGHYPDLNREEVRIWWGLQYQDLFEAGLEFVWQDMTTPAIHPSYGDMKGLPTRLWVNSGSSKDKEKKKLAIESWALYSYNLHKATFHGLGRLPCRKNKRNFILGRGSFAGAYRYAGLWTGDNASTWNFWRITVPQVLSLGLNGVCIAGSDTGGFEPSKDKNNQEEKYCSPELLIRWYAGSYLLPWLRNHYVRKTRKWFQEPYAYQAHFDNPNNPNPPPADQKWLYHTVAPTIKYWLELRYSLIQYMYDAMFENAITGMPLARSMLLTDTDDRTFYNESQKFLDNQYMAGDDILVAPIMWSKEENPAEDRNVYLPLYHNWYKSNLRPWDNQGVELEGPVEGGSVINFRAPIVAKEDYNLISNVTPTYIREGAIIPQIGVRQYVGEGGPNRVKFNIYPGKDKVYHTYLDDGVHRDSAPAKLPQYTRPDIQLLAEGASIDSKIAKITGKKPQKVYSEDDHEAKGYYRKVSVRQKTDGQTRTITIEKGHSGRDPINEVGSLYTIILWYAPDFDGKKTDVANATIKVEGAENAVYRNDILKAVAIDVKETLGNSAKITITVTAKKYT